MLSSLPISVQDRAVQARGLQLQGALSSRESTNDDGARLPLWGDAEVQYRIPRISAFTTDPNGTVWVGSLVVERAEQLIFPNRKQTAHGA